MKRKILLVILWVIIGVCITAMFLSAISCTSAQTKERQLTSKVVEQTLGNTVTTTTQLTETTKVDTTISPDLPLPNADGGGILGMILSVLPAGGIGGGLALLLLQYLKGKLSKKFAEGQKEAIDEVIREGKSVDPETLKEKVRKKMIDKGVQDKFHKFVKE